MGQYSFKLPDVGEGTAEAEIGGWRVNVGDRVEEDQPLVDMMTDKATVELTSPVAGVVRSLAGKAGEKAAVGSVLVVLDTEGGANGAAGADSGSASAAAAATPPTAAPTNAATEQTFANGGVSDSSASQSATKQAALASSGSTSRAAPTQSAQGATASETASGKPAPGGGTSPHAAAHQVAARNRALTPAGGVISKAGAAFARPAASPAVRRRAEELGVKLQFVNGSGPGGRITHEDLDAHIGGDASGMAPTAGSQYAKRIGVDEVPVIGLRRQIAERMQLSKRQIPHFTYVEEIDVTELENLRAHLNQTKSAQQPKLTLLPFFIRALVRVLPEFPQINATYDDEAGIVRRSAPVHVGMAVQTPKGLLVAVVKHAETRDLWDCAEEIGRLAKVARDGKASRDELTGSTITLTSLGALGGVMATPVINRPEVAIIGPNKIVRRPVVRDDDQVVIRKMMNLSSSFDHRVVDGADAAEFIQRMRSLLEQPATIFV